MTLSVDYDGMTYDPSMFAYIPTGVGTNIQYAPIANGAIPAGEVAILFLNAVPGATGPHRVAGLPQVGHPRHHEQGRGDAQHTGAQRLPHHDVRAGRGVRHLPVRRRADRCDQHAAAADLGVGHQLRRRERLRPRSGARGPAVLTMVAQQDNTQITINPVADIKAGTGVAAGAKGMPSTTINKGGCSSPRATPSTAASCSRPTPSAHVGRQDGPRHPVLPRRLGPPADPARARARQRVRRVRLPQPLLPAPPGVAPVAHHRRCQRYGAQMGSRCPRRRADHAVAGPQVTEFEEQRPLGGLQPELEYHPFYVSAHPTRAPSSSTPATATAA